MLEAAARAGGAIATEQHDDCVVECGPESLRPGSMPAWELIRDLGLAPQVVGADASAKRRYLLLEDGLVRTPEGILDALRGPLVGKRSFLRIFAEPVVRPGADRSASVRDVLARRLGSRLADKVADPVVAGIFGGDPHALEFASVFARVQALEDQHGSWLVGGMRRRAAGDPAAPKVPFTFRDGMQTLTDTLVEAQRDQLRLGARVTGLERTGGAWRVCTDDDAVAVDHVVITAPAHAAAALVDDSLSDWPHAPLASVHLAFVEADLPRPLDGFGWLAHSRVRRDVLGAIWVSAVFRSHARPGVALIRMMVGGARMPSLVDESEHGLVEHCRGVLADVQGLHATPLWTHVARHRPGIPQYVRGHAARLARLRRDLPAGLHVAGWGYGGIGLADGMTAASELAERLVR